MAKVPRDDATVMEDVFDDRSIDEHPMVGEEAAMATPPHRLGTHDSNSPVDSQRSQLRNTRYELGGGHMVRVPAELLIAQGDTVGFCPGQGPI